MPTTKQIVEDLLPVHHSSIRARKSHNARLANPSSGRKQNSFKRNRPFPSYDPKTLWERPSFRARRITASSVRWERQRWRQSMTATGTNHDGNAGIRADSDRFNLGMAYGINLIGNNYQPRPISPTSGARGASVARGTTRATSGSVAAGGIPHRALGAMAAPLFAAIVSKRGSS